MAGVPIKFRCYQCNLLLGISRSKVGSIVNCPKCSAQLIVPEPDDSPAESAHTSTDDDPPSAETTPAFPATLAEAIPAEVADIRPEDLRVEMGIDLSDYPRSAPDSSATATVEPEPTPHLESPEPMPVMVRPPAPAEKSPDPDAPPQERPSSTPAAEPVVPPIKVAAPTLVTERTTVRARDLVLPRSVVASWSLFVLVAQALAFLAGLLAGHFVWRVH